MDREQHGKLVAGVDTSTQSTKVLVVDLEDGRVVASGRAPHTVETDDDGRSETHPDVWWRALRDALAATGVADRIAALSVAGQQHGLVLQDARGHALRPAVLWNDTRSASVVDRLRTALGGEVWAERIGSVPVASFTVTSLAWLRDREPDTVAAAHSIRLPHDHLTERLTGRGVTDRGDASGTGWWSATEERYLAEVLDLVELEEGRLPEVLAPGAVAGEVHSEAARDLGLAPGAVVAAGTGDNMAAALGLARPPGAPVVSLGTSGTGYVTSRTPTRDASGVVAGFADADGAFLPLVCTLNCTLAVDRMAGWLGLDRDAVSEATRCVVLPYLDGERTPDLPRASGTIVGLRHSTTPGEILRAAYEGAAASLLGGFDTIAATGGEVDRDAPLTLIGGGAAGRAWRDVVARLSGRAIHLPDAQELVAIGAAVQAAAALTGETATEIARSWDTSRGRVLDPVPRDDAALDRIRSTSAALRPALQTH
ncbi:xylulokinase [Nitriliruptor alkaliphilus]|uniref:xylulokinase n=1 Tax=Nitriliruptor alkaliphilus TaxID=427918 RepID=UPI00069771A6|nr:xylulokinase [Nitriliruptor alkaliphilus]